MIKISSTTSFYKQKQAMSAAIFKNLLQLQWAYRQERSFPDSLSLAFTSPSFLAICTYLY